MSWAFTEEKLRRRIPEVRDAAVRDKFPLAPIHYRIASLPVAEAAAPNFDDSTWAILPDTNAWGSEPEITAWLRAKVTVPDHWKGGRIQLRVRPRDCEILAYLDGKPAQAFDGAHHDMLLTDKAKPGQAYQLALRAYSGLPSTGEANPYFGLPTAKEHHLAEAEVRWVDPATYKLAFDLSFAFESALTLDKNSREYITILNTLDQALNLLDFRQGKQSEEFYASAAEAQKYLQNELFNKYHASEFAPTLWACGHAHIDTAWLWRLAHTREKCGRTFSTVLEMMRQYPDYKFTCSQPQQYKYVKEDYPEVYAGIKEAVARGQWETVGGMWIESDCNVVGGESLVRQFLYGLRFYQKEFGTHTNVVWLPDVFGYSAAFPQIIRKAGMKYFMTIKIFWNQVNKPPYQTFKWVGIDGTDVLVHFSPLGDYNAHMTPEQFKRNWDNYTQKNIADSCLYIYGWGDGGGGPTYQMLEVAERAQDFVGTPKVKLSSAEAFFEDIDKQVSDNRLLPIWNGELYLEYHRGTYTSQARNKRANRQSEILAQTAEQLSSLAGLLAGHAYPQEQINDAWETILLNQFHDIIPGSSIHEVYLDSDKDYAQVRETLETAANGALSALAGRVPASAGEAVAYNPLPWARQDVVSAPASLSLKGQSITDLDGNAKTLVELDGSVPSLGYAAIAGGFGAGEGTLTASADRLENQFFRIDLDKNKEIVSLFDKRLGREVIDKNSYCRGNALLTFEDKPMDFDAWDIDVYYQEKMYTVQDVADIKVIETGPIRASVEITRKIENGLGSTIRQRISLYRNLPRIDFETEVDWHEKQTLLKVAFPVTVNALRATYDIQFGHIERPTYWNTSWDWARFEVCGHKWADLSEGDYGVSLLSDCKYGWDIRDNVMRLTLLKSAIHPDPKADEGRQVFTYSLYPHAGDWRAAGTVQRAYELNVPVQFAAAAGNTAGSDLAKSFSLATIDAENLIIETVKKAEDDDSLIVRLYEAYNQRGNASITFGRPVREARSVNLLEDAPDGSDPEVAGSTIRFAYKPFEIKTFKVQLG